MLENLKLKKIAQTLQIKINPQNQIPIIRKKMLLLLLLPLIVAAVVGWEVRAATYTVSNLNNNGAGSLRQAIDDANATAVDDVIEFSVTGTITLAAAQLDIADASTAGKLTINGPGANRLTISGGNVTRVLYLLPGADLTLNKVTVSDGNGAGPSPGFGGGIVNDVGTLTVNNSIISGNSTNQFSNPSFGGGIFSSEGTLTLNSSIVNNNTVNLRGGGIYNFGSNAKMTLNDSTVSSNSAGSGGGGITNNTSEFMILNNSTVHGNSAQDGGGILSISGITSLDNATISGNSAYAGGAIFNAHNSILELDGSTISGNAGSDGGGILNLNTVTINNSVVHGNSANNVGGGIFNIGNGSLTLDGSTISGNSAGNEGGGIMTSIPVTINYSTISGNSASRGGGISNANETTTVNNSTISGNSAGSEGGGIMTFGTMLLNNSTVSGNSTPGVGGGINNAGGILTANNSTISSNTAAVDGGGLINFGTASLNNSILANSNRQDCVLANGTINASHSLIENNLGCINGTSTSNKTGDPRLGPLRNNGGPTETHALLPGSSAINMGDNSLIPLDSNNVPFSFDQRGDGFPRIINGIVDMGAFEFNPDDDFDGVPNTADLCPGTILPEPEPSGGLMKNRFTANANGNFVDGVGTFSGYTIIDTGGCSSAQIIEQQGLGGGQAKFGITRGELENWIETVP